MESNIKGESNLGWIDAKVFVLIQIPVYTLRFFSLLLVFFYCMLGRLKPLLMSKAVLQLSPLQWMEMVVWGYL